MQARWLNCIHYDDKRHSNSGANRGVLPMSRCRRSSKADNVDHLCYELRLWSEQGNLHRRPVSTVHLGGGTPTFLGETGLTRVVECCRECFHVSSDTEWALEATVESLTTGMIAAMHALGFRRLHIGVQSLEDPVRAEIGRRRPAAEVLEKVEATLARGWVVSVDLLCRLPLQTLEGFVAGIETLTAAGVVCREPDCRVDRAGATQSLSGLSGRPSLVVVRWLVRRAFLPRGQIEINQQHRAQYQREEVEDFIPVS